MTNIKSRTTAIIVAIMVAFMPMVAEAASKPAKVKSVKVTKKTQTSVTLKWKKAKRAKKYQVFVKSSKKYKKVKTLKKTKVTIKKLKAGKTYRFKVRGIRGKKVGKFSKVIKAKTVKKVNKKAKKQSVKQSENQTTNQTTQTNNQPTQKKKPVYTDANGVKIHDLGAVDFSYEKLVTYLKVGECYKIKLPNGGTVRGIITKSNGEITDKDKWYDFGYDEIEIQGYENGVKKGYYWVKSYYTLEEYAGNEWSKKPYDSEYIYDPYDYRGKYIEVENKNFYFADNNDFTVKFGQRADSLSYTLNKGNIKGIDWEYSENAEKSEKIGGSSILTITNYYKKRYYIDVFENNKLVYTETRY